MLKADLKKIKFWVSKTKDERIALNLIKENYSIDFLSKNFHEILNLPNFSNHYINNIKCDNLLNLEDNKIFLHDTIDIWKELSWILLILNKYSKLLKEYNSLNEEYEILYLSGDFKKASDLLYEIEECCGKSIWSLKNRISLTQDIDGLDAQKKLTSSLISSKISPSLHLLIYFYSLAIEKNTSYDYFSSKLKTFFNDTEHDELYHFFMFLLKKDHLVSPINIIYILNRLSTSSIIDLNNAFKRILINIASFEIDDKYSNKKYFIKLLRKFYNNTDSKDIINYLRYFDVDIKLTDIEKNVDYLKVNDYSLIQDTENLHYLTKQLILDKPNNICLYSFFSETLSIYNNDIFKENTLAFDIIENLKNLQFDNVNFNSSIYNLLKLTSIGIDLSCINYIVCYVYEKIPDLSNRVLNSKELLSFLPDPNKNIYYNNDLSKNYLKELAKIDEKLIFHNVYYKVYYETENSFIKFLDTNNLSNETNLLCKSFFYKFNMNYVRLIEIYNELITSDSSYIRNYAKEIYLETLIAYDIFKATEILIDRYLENPFSQLALPIRKICNFVEENIDKYGDWPDSIDVVILFHIYFKKRKLDKKSRLEFLYENYLIQNGCTTPLELINKYKRNNHIFTEKDKYFFREICIPNIMKKSIYFKEPEKKEIERINICHEMIVYDLENDKLYENEIKYREKERFLKKEMIRTGKNKIYVNIEGIKEILKKLLSEDFTRFKNLSKNSDFKIEEVEIYNYLRSFYVYNREENRYEPFNNIPSNEVYDLMKNMVDLIRDTFVDNEHYGLNVYLSTRIRHGTLKNHLRKLVEETHLISLKRKRTGRYNTNEYWKNIFSIESDEINVLIQNYLEDFSREYDSTIDFITTNLLQVVYSSLSVKNNPDALFKYNLSEEEMKYIMKDLIHPYIDIDEFIDNIIDFMWEKTDNNLNLIRKKLENDILGKIGNLFDTLYSNIDSVKIRDERRAKEFKSVINKSKLDSKKYIDGLSSWFNRLEIHDRNDYVIKDVIDLIRKTIPKIKNEIVVENDISIKLKGITFVYFLDIFENLINNVIKHNEENKIPKIFVYFSIENETNLFIEVLNKVSIKKSIHDLNNDLEVNRNMFLTKTLTKKVSTEGKTGFIKIGRIIKFDLNISKFDLDFRYATKDNNDMFRVKINLDIKDILA
jgi:hypothetical protein